MANNGSNLGALDREVGKNLEALAHLNEAVKISRRIHDWSGEAAPLAELSRVERVRGNYAIAHQRAEDASAALESVRLAVAGQALRASFFASVRDVEDTILGTPTQTHPARSG